MSENKTINLMLAETEVSSGSVPVTWCIDDNWLKDNSLKGAYVLLATSPLDPYGKSSEWRGFAKLSDLMGYVTFLQPGKNRISACLVPHRVWIESWMNPRIPILKYPQVWDDESIEEASRGKWEYNLDFNRSGTKGYDFVDINLPQGCFAPEPSKFEKYWVNFFWRNKAVDQCEFRRRRLLAYSIQPLIFLVLFLIRLVCALILTLAGCKGINYCAVWTPTLELHDLWDDINGNYLISKKLGKFNSLSVFIPWVTTGLIVLAATLGVLTAIYILAIVLCGVLLAWGFRVLIDKPLSSWNKKKLDKWTARQQEWLSCQNDMQFSGISSLPRKKRTIRLRFQALKSRVCRPFSR